MQNDYDEFPVIIFAGGKGSRLSEETITKPKPMIEIAGRPIIEHIIEIYARQGFSNFIIATGYLNKIVDEWVAGLDKTLTFIKNVKISTQFTGIETQTGSRLQKILSVVDARTFLCTYGDGLANINLPKLLEFHEGHGRWATVTSVKPPPRFGYVESEYGLVTRFGEKDPRDVGWINGGFFVFSREIENVLSDDNEPLEDGPMSKLVQMKQLMTYCHSGFWQPMDTLREKNILDKLASSDEIPWFNIV